MKTKTLFYVQTIIIIILVVLLFRCCNDDTCSNLNFENSPNKISATMANDMEELYKSNQFLTLNQAQGIEDHREYWFALKELKSYICYIEEKADSLNYNQNGLGIRVYNAAKIEGDKVKSSIFMIGTHNILLDQADSPNNGEPQENNFFPESNINFNDDKAFNMGDPGGKEFENGSN